MNPPGELKLRASLDVSDVGRNARKAADALNTIGQGAGAAGGSNDQAAAVAGAAYAGSMIGTAIASALSVGIRDLRMAFTDFIREQRAIYHDSNTTGVSASFLRGGTLAFGRVGADEGAFSEIVRHTSAKRMDALAGDPKALESFLALGLDPKDSVEALIRKLGETIARSGVDEKTQYFGKQIMGAGTPEAMFAFRNYAAHGLDNETSASAWFMNRFMRTGDHLRDFFMGPRFSTRGSEPVSTFQVEQEMRAREARARNDEHEARIQLERLPVQERINQLIKDEEGLYRMERGQKDPALREEIRAKRLGVAAEIFSTNYNPGKAYRMGGDELSRIGLFLGGSADNLPDLSKAQLNELRQVNAQLRSLPSQLGGSL